MLNIYIANLGKYVEGYLVGKWISLPCTEDELQELYVNIGVARFEDDEFIYGKEINGIVYEEIAIHDYETDLGIKIEEYDSISRLNELSETVNGNEVEFSAIYKATGNIDESLRILEGGDFILLNGVDNDKDLGYEWVTQGLLGIEIPTNLENYIDYEAIGRDLSYDFTYTEYGAISIY